MIKVIDDWYITVEANPINYVVRHGDGKKDKNGKMKDRGLAYFSTLHGAVKFIRGQIIAEELSDGLRTLGDAIADIDKANERFELLMAKIEA